MREKRMNEQFTVNYVLLEVENQIINIGRPKEHAHKQRHLLESYGMR